MWHSSENDKHLQQYTLLPEEQSKSLSSKRKIFNLRKKKSWNSDHSQNGEGSPAWAISLPNFRAHALSSLGLLNHLRNLTLGGVWAITVETADSSSWCSTTCAEASVSASKIPKSELCDGVPHPGIQELCKSSSDDIFNCIFGDIADPALSVEKVLGVCALFPISIALLCPIKHHHFSKKKTK